MSIIRSLEIVDDKSQILKGYFVHDGHRYRLQGNDNSINQTLMGLLDYKINAKLLSELVHHLTTALDVVVEKTVSMQQTLADSMRHQADLVKMADFNKKAADEAIAELEEVQRELEEAEEKLKIYEAEND